MGGLGGRKEKEMMPLPQNIKEEIIFKIVLF